MKVERKSRENEEEGKISEIFMEEKGENPMTRRRREHNALNMVHVFYQQVLFMCILNFDFLIFIASIFFFILIE